MNRNETITIKQQIVDLLKNKYFYIGLAMLFIGIETNFLAQKYLLECVENGKILPSLSDLILENIPYWDIDFLYDIFSLTSIIVILISFIKEQKINKISYMLLLCGFFQVVRGLFIILTPLGNPPGFNGTDGPFNGFTEIELGVYPSGHTGIAFLLFLLGREKPYRQILLFSVIGIIITLFISRGHYTIDILSGVFFAYAIKAYSDKHLLKYFDSESLKKVQDNFTKELSL